MNPADQISKLLESDSIEKQIAAAIVIAELRIKGPEVTTRLTNSLASGVPLLQRHALNALAVVGAKKGVDKIFPLLLSSDAEVRRSAAKAVVSVGEEILPMIRGRMGTANPEEKRALDGVLAELGGRDAFSALLSGLTSGDEEAARQAAIAVRLHVKEADGRERRSYLIQVEKFLEKQKKNKTSTDGPIAAAIKIVGYLEDEKTIPLLLEYITSKKSASIVRQEAIIALRFALGEKKGDKKGSTKVVDALLDAATSDDRALATTALHTLGSLEIPSGMAPRLEKLVQHPDLERARFVIEQLGRQKDEEGAKLLVKLVSFAEKRRAEFAAQALSGNEKAAPLLGKALLEIRDRDRAWMVRNIARPMAKLIPKATHDKLLETSIAKLTKGELGWEASLDVVREAFPDKVADALRTLAQKLRKAQPDKAETVWSLLCRSDKATNDDRFSLASLMLKKSGKDTQRESRAGDESLRQLKQLAQRGFDLASAMKKDRGLELDDLYYVGFHFAEEGALLGSELLSFVVDKAGRTKIGKMAKNKLELSE